jgi:hypothetical protein
MQTPGGVGMVQPLITNVKTPLLNGLQRVFFYGAVIMAGAAKRQPTRSWRPRVTDAGRCQPSSPLPQEHNAKRAARKGRPFVLNDSDITRLYFALQSSLRFVSERLREVLDGRVR